MEIACDNGCDEIVALLLRHGSQGRPLSRAVRSGNAKVVKLILEAGMIRVAARGVDVGAGTGAGISASAITRSASVNTVKEQT